MESARRIGRGAIVWGSLSPGRRSWDNRAMREVKRSALVAQPPSRLFALINDIESYPRFLPWCTHAHVQSRTEREIVATIGVKRGPLHGEFTTRNELEPDRRIDRKSTRLNSSH